jgi:signal transduction histidine kinase
LNNAFFAMQEKNKLTIGNYIPTMYIKTNRQQDFIETRIRDNATGIPANIIEKIFDPFFTTKPTGTGNTGLGLSIVYDIITKRHHGKIKVISEAGEFTEFIIQLPISSKII